jgi:hypothetical protein
LGEVISDLFLYTDNEYIRFWRCIKRLPVAGGHQLRKALTSSADVVASHVELCGYPNIAIASRFWLINALRVAAILMIRAASGQG